MFTDEERIKGSAKLPAHSRHSHAPLKLLAEMAAEHGRELVALFYDTLLRDQEAAQFLNHAVVQERLSSSLIEWLTQLFSGQDIRDSPKSRPARRSLAKSTLASRFRSIS
ncbi:protoglobin domain-containing protein [Sphingobium scionense]